MRRAIAKAALLAAFGHVPGGASVYRRLTRQVAGTQKTHVDKLARAWPEYAHAWRRCGLRLEGARFWIHEGGYTPFPFLAGYLVTGAGAVVTNVEAELTDRYVAHAVNGALTAAFSEDLVPEERRKAIEPLRWAETGTKVVSATGGSLSEDVDPGRIPLASRSIDLCHSGGTLEHYEPWRLRAFLAECRRILRPGGIASHVFDHRDHLHHADAAWPFLAHLAMPDRLYRFLCGHDLGYHNRLCPAEVVSLFEEAGFERVAIRRLLLPSRSWAEGDDVTGGEPGLSRRYLTSRFANMSEADLHTAACHYLFRRRPDQGAASVQSLTAVASDGATTVAVGRSGVVLTNP